MCRRALLPPSVVEFAPSVGCPPGNLAAVSDSAYSRWLADMARMQRIGFEGGVNGRKFLAGTGELRLTRTGATKGGAVTQMWPVTRAGLVNGHLDRDPVRPERPAPVVRDLGRLADAMLAVPTESPGRRGHWWRSGKG